MASLVRVVVLLVFSSNLWAQGEKSKPLQPEISANFLGLFQRGTNFSDDRKNPPFNGFSLQEAELIITSDVDPYTKAMAIFGVHQEEGEEHYGIDPEEVYFETIFIPRLTIKGGKFKAALGKHNQLHTHDFPFIDAPLVHQKITGDHGLNEIGLSAALLIPLGWYSEFTLQGFSLQNKELFNSQRSGDIGGLARWTNLWDLTDDLTMEWGFSGVLGRNQVYRNSSALGSDLTFKWRPSVGGKYNAVVWSTEYLYGDRKDLPDASGASLGEVGGVATWVRYQFAQRWWIQGRYEYLGLPEDSTSASQSKKSALLGFFPSEFSGVRLQYDYLNDLGTGRDEQVISLQYNVTIGAHPAHAY